MLNSIAAKGPCRDHAVLPEPELTEPVELCDPKGNLAPAAVGWSRRPLHACNLSHHWLRKKRWNYWCVADDRCLFSATVSNLDYIGLAFAYWLEFDSGRFIEKSAMVPLGKGCRLPEIVGGDVEFRHRDLSMSFIREYDKTRIRVESPNFGGTRLDAEFVAQLPEGHETMNVVIPWSRRRFQFTAKQNCLPATGMIRLDGHETVLQQGKAFAALDYGRGVWPYSGFWNWASFSGVEKGTTLGVNLGAGWTDGTGMTENALIVDGRVSKIHEDVVFTYNTGRMMEPWRIQTKHSNRVDLQFTPFFERVARTNFLILGSEMHQMIGRFSGTFVDDSGRSHSLKGLIGWAEQHKARW